MDHVNDDETCVYCGSPKGRIGCLHAAGCPAVSKPFDYKAALPDAPPGSGLTISHNAMVDGRGVQIGWYANIQCHFPAPLPPELTDEQFAAVERVMSEKYGRPGCHSAG